MSYGNHSVVTGEKTIFSLSLLLPLIVLSGLGFVCAKYQLLRSDWLSSTNEITLKLFIPSLLFLGSLRYGLPADLSWQLLVAYYLPFLLAFVLFNVLLRKHPFRAQFSLAAVYGNTVFIGIPLVVQVLGEASLRFTFPIIAFHSLTGFSLYYFSDLWQRGAGAWLASLVKTLRNPIVFSLLLGLLCSAFGVVLPAALNEVLSLLAGAALPCALLVLGASLAQFRLEQQSYALLISLAKLFLLPLLVFMSGFYLFALPLEVVTVMLILASCPVGVNAYILAADDQKGVVVVGASILLSTLLSIVSVPLLLFLLP